ncbi:M16 family metallopeptidase [Roseinatronobacter bogoriensis]|uniref:Insulinase family protein n=1 Tax=Roseinatronobacter bogoriensis subsp. barguzinensis TaxID=441209 RepID=A0A2K8K6Q4_9RHOB|nr:MULTISPECIES: pitrilysin family protein [Rhodobaca]ATX65109.1 insulinase family protein [Rhodobaca barguzinensis]MBB4209598.1 zinc protease [Rhodobaca bogoriensis DSM 18756]TDW35411.1 zinc protease [Rhodobaca barguzinensis]TDY66621.1 zinc protease [Rhodobaca bogoriensis DSM 18756]
MKRLIALFILAAFPLRAEVDITHVTSPSGLEAWLVEERSIPFVSLELIFPGGAALESDAQAGVVNLMTSLLSEGAGDMDAQAFAARSEELATRIRFDSGRDSVSVSVRFLTEDADEVIDHLRLALTEPRFDEDAIARTRGQLLAQLRRDVLDPNTIASRAFARAAFQDHPYGRESNGTPETVGALDRDALVAAHQGAITRDRVYIGAAGDISADALGELLDRLFEGVPETGWDMPDRAEFLAEPGMEVIDFNGPQSVIAFGHAGIARDDPEFLTAFVVNEVFGGGRFGTRLMRSLREERGLTYGIGAFLSSGALGESYQGRLSTDNANVEIVIDLLREEWAQIASEGVTEEELARIQTYLTGAYPLRFDGNSSIASIMASMQYQGFDIDYVNRRNDMISALTLDEVNDLASRLYNPEALFFVVVGQPVGLN